MKQRPIGLPKSRHEGRLGGQPVLKGTSFHPDGDLFNNSHLTVLHHSTILSVSVDQLMNSWMR